MSRYSWVIDVTGYRIEGLVSITARGRRSFLCHDARTATSAHTGHAEGSFSRGQSGRSVKQTTGQHVCRSYGNHVRLYGRRNTHCAPAAAGHNHGARRPLRLCSQLQMSLFCTFLCLCKCQVLIINSTQQKPTLQADGRSASQITRLYGTRRHIAVWTTDNFNNFPRSYVTFRNMLCFFLWRDAVNIQPAKPPLVVLHYKNKPAVHAKVIIPLVYI